MIIEMLLDGEKLLDWVYPDDENNPALTFSQNAEAKERAVAWIIRDIKSRCSKIIEKCGDRISFCLVFRSQLKQKPEKIIKSRIEFK
jgi:hypothetical protein